MIWTDLLDAMHHMLSLDVAMGLFGGALLGYLIGSIPGLNHLLTEQNTDHQQSNTLLVIKPTVTRLPMTNAFSPQFLLGAHRGERVLI